jgi:hypothetical protein
LVGQHILEQQQVVNGHPIRIRDMFPHVFCATHHWAPYSCEAAVNLSVWAILVDVIVQTIEPQCRVPTPQRATHRPVVTRDPMRQGLVLANSVTAPLTRIRPLRASFDVFLVFGPRENQFTVFTHQWLKQTGRTVVSELPVLPDPRAPIVDAP